MENAPPASRDWASALSRFKGRGMAEDIEELLSKMTMMQLKFWELMQSGKATQVQAYRASFNVAEETSNNSVQVDASRLWNNPKFILCRNALTNAITSQVAKTKEARIAEMQSFSERCEAAGQLGAACKAKELVGKLEGHYVDRVENINKTRDQVHSLAAIADSLGKDRALEMAKDIGLHDELLEHLATLQ